MMKYGSIERTNSHDHFPFLFGESSKYSRVKMEGFLAIENPFGDFLIQLGDEARVKLLLGHLIQRVIFQRVSRVIASK